MRDGPARPARGGCCAASRSRRGPAASSPARPASSWPLPPEGAPGGPSMFGAVHSARTADAGGALLVLAREFTPRVEACGPATVLLDLQGLARAWPQPSALGHALFEAARGRGLDGLGVALAFSRVAARLLAAGREGLTVAGAGEEAQLLAPLPLDLLGLATDRADLFRRWG